MRKKAGATESGPTGHVALLPSPDTPQIWLLWPADVVDERLRSDYPALLDEREQQHYRRLRLADVRQQYLLTRVLVRTTLSHYRCLPPRDWRFAPQPHGKPVILNPEGAGLRFNVAHTRHLIACAVLEERDIGIDVEWTARHNDLSGISQRFFSASECTDLQRLPTDRRADRFFDYWTLKEAYIKARGLGLACPLGAFSFVLQPDRSIRLRLDVSVQDDRSDRWQFWLARPGERHRLAICAERAGNEESQPRTHRVVPLVSRRDWPLVWSS